MPGTLLSAIQTELAGVQMVDTHEHLIPESLACRMKPDLMFWFLHYASSDAVSAGMMESALGAPREISNKSYLEGAWAEYRTASLEERWKRVSPFWWKARNTGYARALLIAARDLFGVSDINDETYRVLSEKISSAYHPGWYEEVFGRAGIQVAVVCPLPRAKPEEMRSKLFAMVVKLDDFVGVRNAPELCALERKTDTSIHSLDELVSAMGRHLEKEIGLGCVGIKTSLAYSRTLQYDKTSRAEAERVFQQVFLHMKEGPSWSEAKPLQDYLMHQVIRLAEDHGLPVQVHTGLQEGNGNILSNSNPLHLTNLFLEYKRVKFDIFHGSYPFCGELSALAKNFQNVYVDMCWLHIISPSAARRALHEWIETVPGNKIFGFGGDYLFVEGSYGHAVMARANISRVLREKVEEGYMTEVEAADLGKRLLRENALEFFGLATERKLG